MENRTAFLRACLCAGICVTLDFVVIPNFLMRGVTDWIWMSLMALLPAAASVWILHGQKRVAVLWSMGLQLLLVTLLSRPIGGMLGLQMGSIAWDLFDYIQYVQFAWGFVLAGSVLGWLILRFWKG